MTIFAVLMPTMQPALIERIERTYADNSLRLNETQYLISTSGTAIELSTRLGIADPKNPNQAPTGSAVVLATTAYFGRAPSTVWDWMKARLEAPPNG